MINPKYAVKCLKLGFLRYQRYRKLPISVEVSNNTISFYAKNQTRGKGKNARISHHHLSMQRFAEKNQPWLCDNISIVFIVPDSPEDKSPRARLYQNAEGSIKEFDVTIYPYNPNLLEPNDISVIFQAIAKYLESGEYIDPFKGTDKESEPIPRHSHIKPYKGKVKKLSEGLVRLDNVLLNEIGQYCVNQYLLLNEYKQNNCNQNMNTNNKNVVRLKESQLQSMILHSVKQVLSEAEFKRVDNLNDYISQNGLKGRMASKFQRVNAQQGSDYIRQYLKQHPELSREEVRNILQNGAPLSTVASDGTQETNNLVTRNHTILNNVGNANNRWAVDNVTFNKKYQPGEGKGVYKPAGKPMRAYPVNEPISFTAPWGEEMNIDAGGQILQDADNPNDIYGISGKDFENTYKFQESKKRMAKLTENHLHDIITESVRRALNEISKDTIDNAYVQSMQRDVSVDSLSPAKKRQYDKLIANGYQPEVALNMVVGNQRWNFANRINQDITNGGKVTPYNVTQGENGRFPFSKGTRQNKRLQNIQNKTNQQQIQKTVPYQGRWADSHDMDVYGSLDYIPKNYADNTRFNRAAKYSYDWFSDEDKASHDMRPQV